MFVQIGFASFANGKHGVTLTRLVYDLINYGGHTAGPMDL